VVVVTETARQEHFAEFVMDLQLQGLLERVVYDEAHKLVSDKRYRHYISGSKKLRLRCQIMFITGTCPEGLVRDIQKEMVILVPHVIRDDYYKPRFIYTVVVCEQN